MLSIGSWITVLALHDYNLSTGRKVLVRHVKKEKHAICFEIQDAMKRTGCPICSILRDLEEDTIKYMLYSQVNDPAVRKKLRQSLGLCPYHAWLLADIVRGNPEIDLLGPSIIYEDMLRTYLEEGENRNGECFLCAKTKEFERIYIEEMASCIEIDPTILDEYSKSRSTLCRRHYEMLLSHLDGVLRAKLEEIQRGKLERIIHNLSEYIRKQDYRVKEPPTYDEARAWLDAIIFLKGERISTNIYSREGMGEKHKRRKHLFSF